MNRQDLHPGLAPPRASAEIRALTGIRGLAACYVMIYHYFQYGPSASLPQMFVKHGYIAVDLFSS